MREELAGVRPRAGGNTARVLEREDRRAEQDALAGDRRWHTRSSSAGLLLHKRPATA